MWNKPTITMASDSEAVKGAGEALAAPAFEALTPNSTGDGRRNCLLSAEKATPMTLKQAHKAATKADESYETQAIHMAASPGDSCPDPETIVAYVFGDTELRNDTQLPPPFHYMSGLSPGARRVGSSDGRTPGVNSAIPTANVVGGDSTSQASRRTDRRTCRYGGMLWSFVYRSAHGGLCLPTTVQIGLAPTNCLV